MTINSVLFVCLGNICRSPLAEAVFQDIVTKRQLQIKVDSSGTSGFHINSEPDERSIEVCNLHNVPINSRCRQLCASDFTEFDLIVGMDKANVANIERAKPKNSTAKIVLFGSYVDGKEIKDPYYDAGLKGFEKAYQQTLIYSEALLAAEL